MSIGLWPTTTSKVTNPGSHIITFTNLSPKIGKWLFSVCVHHYWRNKLTIQGQIEKARNYHTPIIEMLSSSQPKFCFLMPIIYLQTILKVFYFLPHKSCQLYLQLTLTSTNDSYSSTAIERLDNYKRVCSLEFLSFITILLPEIQFRYIVFTPYYCKPGYFIRNST